MNEYHGRCCTLKSNLDVTVIQSLRLLTRYHYDKNYCKVIATFSERNIYWELDRNAASQEILLSKFNVKVYYRFLNSTVSNSILIELNQSHTLSPYVLKFRFNIILHIWNVVFGIYDTNLWSFLNWSWNLK
jgi:hypothetical protein